MEPVPPTCYRHPDRRAGVTCQRCSRPICPDCMVQASVGFHCPECARSGRQKVVRGPQAVGAAGGGLLVTNLLIAVNVAVFVYGMGGNLETRDSVFHDGALFGPYVADGEWWRIVTSGFLHANLIHVALNCWVLYNLGRLVEPALGRLRFGLVYAVALLAGSFGVLLVDPNSATVGASGAVFGLMGAALAMLRARGINPMQTSIGSLVMLNVLITFVVPNISIGGHLGGLAGGFVAGWILTDLGPKQWRDQRIPAALVVLVGVAVSVGCFVVAGG